LARAQRILSTSCPTSPRCRERISKKTS
jgi:hypothetical protein